MSFIKQLFWFPTSNFRFSMSLCLYCFSFDEVIIAAFMMKLTKCMSTIVSPNIWLIPWTDALHIHLWADSKIYNDSRSWWIINHIKIILPRPCGIFNNWRKIMIVVMDSCFRNDVCLLDFVTSSLQSAGIVQISHWKQYNNFPWLIEVMSATR
jgi:hypothetical protein